MTGAACLLAATTGTAQSAADKATARNLATEGIRLFQEGKHNEALDRLQRAQALYDAPIHLVYVARAQAKLGRLVEAAETYRRLVRTELGPKAPGPFRDAVKDGERELAELEPRIPALTITLDAAPASGLELRIDDEVVSAAVLGVRRPINPGHHSVKVTAPGYAGDERAVDVKEAQNASVHLSLGPPPPSPPEGAPLQPPGSAPLAEPTKQETPSQQQATEPSPTQSEPASWAVVLGLRPGALVPSGRLYHDPVAGDVDVSDRFGAGVGFEARAGLLFLRYFTGFLYFEGYALNAGQGYEAPQGLRFPVAAQATPTLRAGGLGVSVGTGPPGSAFERVRVFGELAISVVEAFGAEVEATSGIGSDALTCSATQTYSGAALRLGGGAQYLWTDWFRIGPYVAASLGQVTSLEGEIDCGAGDAADRFGALLPLSGATEVGADQRRAHASFALGVTGEFVIRVK